jgi:cytochrome P450
MATATMSPQPPPALLSPAFFADPYPTYHALRAASPVVWDDALRSWLLSGYAEVAAALSDPRLARGRTAEEEAAILEQLTASGQGELRPLRRLLWRMMLFSDPPAHTRLRALANQAFTPRVVEGLRPHIQAVVDRALDAVQAAGRMEVIADLAYPLPVIVIGEMLSLPPGEREQFKRWSDDIIAFAARLGADQPGLAGRALRSTRELTEYFRALVAELRRRPNDTLLSALVAAEERGDRLSEEELLANAVLLLMNGHETTTYMIGNALLALLRHPEQRRRLQGDPTLIAPAVEELLRYDGSVQMRGVTAAADLAVGGKQIAKGQSVLLLLGAANRDPAQFPEPDRLDLDRRETRHLDFGRGIHFCIGAALARAELQIAITSVLRRMPGLRLASETLEWQKVPPIFRGLKALPVTF